MTTRFWRMMHDLNAAFLSAVGGGEYRTILADPPWQFKNRTGKMAPEHKRLSRYATLGLDGHQELPVGDVAADPCHLYLWVPNALLPEGLSVLGLGDSNTRRTLVGARCARTAARTAGGWDFISAIQRRCCFSGCAQKRPDPGPGQKPGQRHPQPKAGAFPQARRAVRHHRIMQPGAASGAFRPGHEARMDHLGKSGRGLRAHLGHLRQPLRGGEAGRDGLAAPQTKCAEMVIT